ncbi:unnamed protein product [Microthlaspi erraticum]|uniref:Reverse transcriptase domain-containing protein n=1 Tax=Microthlaspi erraticum TaxID=1685480 RepID=A0A6D2K3T0_9BRAS|nr:unnamed protein product [Microthlaspi erraticum]
MTFIFKNFLGGCRVMLLAWRQKLSQAHKPRPPHPAVVSSDFRDEASSPAFLLLLRSELRLLFPGLHLASDGFVTFSVGGSTADEICSNFFASLLLSSQCSEIFSPPSESLYGSAESSTGTSGSVYFTVMPSSYGGSTTVLLLPPPPASLVSSQPLDLFFASPYLYLLVTLPFLHPHGFHPSTVSLLSFISLTNLDLRSVGVELQKRTLPNSSTIIESSSIRLSFGQSKLHVLLLAGEGTSGSWILDFVNLLILVRRCKTLGLTHDLCIARSFPKLPLPIEKLCYLVSMVSLWESLSSPSFSRGKRIIPSLILFTRGELYSVKPIIFSSFVERVLLSSVLLVLAFMALALRAFHDHLLVLGLKKAASKFTSLLTSTIQSLVDWELVVVVMMFGGVLLLASGYEFVTRGRRAINRFSILEDKEGSPVYEEAEIVEVINSYFQDLFITKSTTCVETVAQALKPCVSPETNEALIAIPTTDEIKSALFSIHPDKAPGPDGFSASFFQTNWETVQSKVVEEIKEIFTSGIVPRSINNTHVRLIPKVSSRRISSYRPLQCLLQDNLKNLNEQTPTTPVIHHIRNTNSLCPRESYF